MWCGQPVQQSSSTKRERSPSATVVRIESCPPALLHTVRSGWTDRLFDWLGQGWPGTPPRSSAAPCSAATPGAMPLSAVRLEFIICLDDIPTRQAADLAERLRQARSLRELWHLRADVFNAVSCHRDQREARERLSRLNRHFPARAPRSGFGGFDALPHAHHPL
jgi:hypothetical protein